MTHLDGTQAWMWMSLFIICLGGSLLRAARQSRQRNRLIERLAGLLKLPAVSQPALSLPFALDDGISGLLFADNNLIVIDLREGGSVVQRLSLEQIAILKIYETKKDRIPFRLVTRRHAETRRIETSAILALSQLINLVSTCGARIEYIPEET